MMPIRNNSAWWATSFPPRQDDVVGIPHDTDRRLHADGIVSDEGLLLISLTAALIGLGLLLCVARWLGLLDRALRIWPLRRQRHASVNGETGEEEMDSSLRMAPFGAYALRDEEISVELGSQVQDTLVLAAALTAARNLDIASREESNAAYRARAVSAVQRWRGVSSGSVEGGIYEGDAEKMGSLTLSTSSRARSAEGTANASTDGGGGSARHTARSPNLSGNIIDLSPRRMISPMFCSTSFASSAGGGKDGGWHGSSSDMAIVCGESREEVRLRSPSPAVGDGESSVADDVIGFSPLRPVADESTPHVELTVKTMNNGYSSGYNNVTASSRAGGILPEAGAPTSNALDLAGLRRPQTTSRQPEAAAGGRSFVEALGVRRDGRNGRDTYDTPSAVGEANDTASRFGTTGAASTSKKRGYRGGETKSGDIGENKEEQNAANEADEMGRPRGTVANETALDARNQDTGVVTLNRESQASCRLTSAGSVDGHGALDHGALLLSTHAVGENSVRKELARFDGEEAKSDEGRATATPTNNPIASLEEFEEYSMSTWFTGGADGERIAKKRPSSGSIDSHMSSLPQLTDINSSDSIGGFWATPTSSHLQDFQELTPEFGSNEGCAAQLFVETSLREHRKQRAGGQDALSPGDDHDVLEEPGDVTRLEPRINLKEDGVAVVLDDERTHSSSRWSPRPSDPAEGWSSQVLSMFSDGGFKRGDGSKPGP